MYKDPFANAENGEPISQEEFDLPFDFDPQHDYFADVDALYPRWTVPEAQYVDSFPLAAAIAEPTVERQQRDQRVRESIAIIGADGKPSLDARGRPRRRNHIVVRGKPFKRFVRAVDPAGNLLPLIISTTRADRDKPTGDDGINTVLAVVQKKNSYGWLIVEPYQELWNPWAGRTGQEYCAWALAVSRHRKTVHAAHEAKEQNAWLEEKRRQRLEEASQQARVIGPIQAEATLAALDRLVERHAEQRGRKAKE